MKTKSLCWPNIATTRQSEFSAGSEDNVSFLTAILLKFFKLREIDFRVFEGVEEDNERTLGYKAQPTEGRTTTPSVVRDGEVNVWDSSVNDAV
jgi:hypothetical protein